MSGDKTRGRCSQSKISIGPIESADLKVLPSHPEKKKKNNCPLSRTCACNCTQRDFGYSYSDHANPDGPRESGKNSPVLDLPMDPELCVRP